MVARSFHGRPRKHLSFVTALALASGDWVCSPFQLAGGGRVLIHRARTRMIREFETYAP